MSTARSDSSQHATAIAESQLVNILFRPTVFLPPDRIVHPPSWLQHIPFAFWLVDVLRPSIFVELGTQSGNSYSAFAQAVQHLGHAAAGYSIDTWKGDPQAGFYDESVFSEWRDYHDRRYRSFSTLIRSTFDEAVDHFENGSIDLLNIDGYHTREAVQHDFETWLPRMSRRGIVLMHDINVRERDFGAWQAWQDIRRRYPSFEFVHGHGLGVVAVGSELPPQIECLVGLEGHNGRGVAFVRSFFARVGGGILAQYDAAEAACSAERLKAEIEGHRRTQADRAHIDGLLAERIAMLEDRIHRQTSELTVRTQEVADLLARLDRTERAHRDTATALDSTSNRLAETTHQLLATKDTLATVEETLVAARSRLEHLQQQSAEEAARRDVARATTEAWRYLAGESARAAHRALDGTRSRVRVLARAFAANSITPSPGGGLRSTLRQLGLTPRQMMRRPRNLGLLLRCAVRPKILRNAHLVAQSRLFDAAHYRRVHPDVVATGVAPLAHFIQAGGAEGRSPHPLFDSAWYLATYPDVVASKTNPLVHYLRSGYKENRDPHALFSSSHYRAQLGAGGGTVNPLRHYVEHGAIEGRSPHPLFDPDYYIESFGAAVTGIDAFASFIEDGATADLNPHPLFDAAYYRSQLPSRERAVANALLHYLQVGSSQGHRPHPLFNPTFYRTTYGDVRDNRVEPLTHYVTVGGREGRLPNPDFDSGWYSATYTDVREKGDNPLVHYVRYGWLEGRNPSPRFDTISYLRRYADVAREGANPLAHYIEHGRAEGRIVAAEDVVPPVEAPASARIRMQPRPLDAAPRTERVVVCLTHVMPVRPRAGNEYRIYRLLRWLKRSGYSIVPVVAPNDGGLYASEAVRAIAEEFGNAVLCLPDGRVEYVLRDIPDVLQSLDGEVTASYAQRLREDAVVSDRHRELLQIDRSFCSDVLVATLLRLQSALGSYVVLAEYIWMSRVLPLVGARALKIIDTHDVLSTRREKVVQFGIEDLSIEPFEERSRLERADVVIAIQENERQALEAIAPGLKVVTGGVDFDMVSDATEPAGRHILYVGSGNPMNRRGLRDFIKFAWPRVRQLVSDAELVVAGAVGESLPVAPDGVNILGKVEDLAPLYRNCRVVINPAVAGTGLKIKTLEALSYRRPVVTWPNGVDGLSAAGADLCRVVNDWYAFSEELAGILKSDDTPWFTREKWELLAREGSPDRVYSEIGEVIETFFSRSSPQSRRVTDSGPSS